VENYIKIVSSRTIRVCVMALPGAQVGRNLTDPIRVQRDFAIANKMWQHKVNSINIGVRFEVIDFIILDKDLQGLNSNAENIVLSNQQLEQNAKILMRLGRKFCPTANLFIVYMKGNTIGTVRRDGTKILAISFIDHPLIIMSNGAKENEFILAHELGHFLFNNNRFGNTSDPNPIKGDPAHNATKTNLMHPTGIYWPAPPRSPILTLDQIIKALEIRFFYH
jgi:hypothetical protein